MFVVKFVSNSVLLSTVNVDVRINSTTIIGFFVISSLKMFVSILVSVAPPYGCVALLPGYWFATCKEAPPLFVAIFVSNLVLVHSQCRCRINSTPINGFVVCKNIAINIGFTTCVNSPTIICCYICGKSRFIVDG